jgi:hypothetical protein
MNRLLLLVVLVLAVPAWTFTVIKKNIENSQIRALKMSVGKKSDYLVTLLPGDGIGPEIIAATVPCLQAIASKHKFSFTFREADIGGIAIDRHNDPFPEITYELCKSSDSVLLASIGGYKWDNNPRHLRPESGY